VTFRHFARNISQPWPGYDALSAMMMIGRATSWQLLKESDEALARHPALEGGESHVSSRTDRADESYAEAFTAIQYDRSFADLPKWSRDGIDRTAASSTKKITAPLRRASSRNRNSLRRYRSTPGVLFVALYRGRCGLKPKCASKRLTCSCSARSVFSTAFPV
jgi:hypothetical protein